MGFGAFILGNLLGFGFAFMLVGILVKRSNDHGDSKGTFLDFNSQLLHVTVKRDDVCDPKDLDYIASLNNRKSLPLSFKQKPPRHSRGADFHLQRALIWCN